MQILLVIILALIPALIWFRIWRGKNIGSRAKKYLLVTFGLGSLSVLFVLLVHYLLEHFPQLDILSFVTSTELPEKEKVLIVLVLVAILEEIAKFLVVYFLDKSKKLINSIHDAIRFSIVAALGFAFAENIYFFFRLGSLISIYQLLALFAFRSIITVCGHLIFSGIFGNFYGISKFSESYSTQEYWGNAKKLDKRTMSKEELKKKATFFKRFTIAKGLFFAVILHASFNFFLELQMVDKVLWLIILGVIFLIYLYKRRSGYLDLVYRRSKFAHMKDRDKDVVLEVIGTWYNEGKYIQVIKTCNRMLKKDPNNPIIQLFLNKAIDNQRFIDAYTAIRQLFIPKNYYEYMDDEK